jgi:hypothetical protein
LKWRTHEIIGKNSCLIPWTQITKFATEISKKLSGRFPATDFLKALDILDPNSWTAYRDSKSNSGIMYL